MPSTFVHALLPASCALSTPSGRPRPTLKVAIKLFVIAAVIGNFPDLDIIPALIFGAAKIHRHWGHNIFVLFGWTWLGQWTLVKLVPEIFKSKRQAFVTSFLLVASHLILDAFQQHNHISFVPHVPLLWPLSDWAFSIPIQIFTTVIPDGASGVFTIGTLKQIALRELVPSFLLFVLWVFAARLPRLVVRTYELVARQLKGNLQNKRHLEQSLVLIPGNLDRSQSLEVGSQKLNFE